MTRSPRVCLCLQACQALLWLTPQKQWLMYWGGGSCPFKINFSHRQMFASLGFFSGTLQLFPMSCWMVYAGSSGVTGASVNSAMDTHSVGMHGCTQHGGTVLVRPESSHYVSFLPYRKMKNLYQAAIRCLLSSPTISILPFTHIPVLNPSSIYLPITHPHSCTLTLLSSIPPSLHPSIFHFSHLHQPVVYPPTSPSTSTLLPSFQLSITFHPLLPLRPLSIHPLSTLIPFLIPSLHPPSIPFTFHLPIYTPRLHSPIHQLCPPT